MTLMTNKRAEKFRLFVREICENAYRLRSIDEAEKIVAKKYGDAFFAGFCARYVKLKFPMVAI